MQTKIKIRKKQLYWTDLNTKMFGELIDYTLTAELTSLLITGIFAQSPTFCNLNNTTIIFFTSTVLSHLEHLDGVKSIFYNWLYIHGIRIKIKKVISTFFIYDNNVNYQKKIFY